MSKKPITAIVAAVAVLAVALPAAFARTDAPAADPGITPTTILLGGASPLSGPASAYASVARGAEAYFKYVNARGGVNGRKIVYRYYDDAYNPAQSVQVTRKLVEEDRVFAVFNSLGTEHNLAVREYLNQAKVPQLFVATGATTFGRDFKRYPWTIGFQPSYRAEGWIYGKYLARTKKRGRIAILFQNDDYGKDLIAGLKQGIARSGMKVVAAQPHEVTASDVQSQVAKLKSSGADVFAIFTTPKFAIQAYVFANKLNWRPLIVNNVVSSASNIMTLASEGNTNRAVEGSLSLVFLKDPTDRKWAADAGTRLYRSIMKRYLPRGNVNDVYHVYGMAVAYETVRVLKAAGRNLTRRSVMAQTARLNDVSNPFMLPGIAIKTSATERFPIEQAQLQRWSKGRWTSFGGLWGYRAG